MSCSQGTAQTRCDQPATQSPTGAGEMSLRRAYSLPVPQTRGTGQDAGPFPARMSRGSRAEPWQPRRQPECPASKRSPGEQSSTHRTASRSGKAFVPRGRPFGEQGSILCGRTGFGTNPPVFWAGNTGKSRTTQSIIHARPRPGNPETRPFWAFPPQVFAATEPPFRPRPRRPISATNRRSENGAI